MSAKGSERQRLALKLKNEGQTYTQIGTHLGVTETRACELVRKAKSAGEVNTAAQRICGDPLSFKLDDVTCQRADSHRSSHRWKGLHYGVMVTIEWQWSNPR